MPENRENTERPDAGLDAPETGLTEGISDVARRMEDLARAIESYEDTNFIELTDR